MNKKIIISFILYLSAFIIMTQLIYSENISVIYNKKSSNYQYLTKVFQNSLQNRSHKITFIDVRGKDINTKVLDSKTQYIFSIGSKASRIARQINLPGLFSYVIYPEKIKLVNNLKIPTSKMHGISCQTNYNYNVEVLKLLFIRNLKLGVLYNPLKSADKIDELEKAADNHDCLLVTQAVTKPEEVLEAFANITDKIDALYLILDSTVVTPSNLKLFIKRSIITKIPVIGLSHNMTKAGALISFYNDPMGIGKKAAGMMESIMNGSMDYTKPIEKHDKPTFTINKKTAKICNIELYGFNSKHLY